MDGDEEVSKYIYRRLADKFQQNELSILEFIHSLVETMDKYFESVCELDVSDDSAVQVYVILLLFVDHVSHRKGLLYC